MKTTERCLLTLITLAAIGCAGTLDDDYFNSAQSDGMPTARGPDAGAPRAALRDSGSAWRDAGTADADWDASTEALPQDSGSDAKPPAADSGSAPYADAGTKSSLPPAADSGSHAAPDAAAVCDFRGLVQMKCASASCHGAPALTSGLDLTSASLATRVAGRKGIGSCQDKLLIDKDNPAQSALYLRVTGLTCGVKMPLGGSLSPNEQACVLSWIEGL